VPRVERGVNGLGNHLPACRRLESE
jgi:hypothetical protein